jgi:hypothetical protein
MQMSLEKRRDRLKKWFDYIFKNATEAIINQHIFWEVQDIIRNNPDLQNQSNAFYVWMGSTFVQSTVLAVRRQVDRDQNSASLLRFLLELQKFPDLISRQYHRSLYERPEYEEKVADEMTNYTYDEHVGAGATVLDVDTIQLEIDSLVDASQKLHHYADRVVAHYDLRGLEHPTPKFDDLTNCLAVVEKLVLRYLVLLKGAAQEELLPTFLYDWKSVFRVQWLR